MMETLLFEAIEQGCLESICNLLSNGVNVNVTNENGCTPLHMAVWAQNQHAVKLLIDAGADVNVKNLNNQTPLCFEFKENYSTSSNAIVKMLIDAGFDTNTKINSSTTVLHEASQVGDTDLVQFLIDRKADVKAIDEINHNYTALHYASENVTCEDSSMFEILLAAGADVNAKSIDGQTPLSVLAGNGGTFSYRKIVEVLLKYGADLHTRDDYNQTPLDFAVLISNTKAVEAIVLCGKINVNSKYTQPINDNSIGDTLLFGAIRHSFDKSMIKFLLKHGADINKLDTESGMSPLQRAIDAAYVFYQSTPERFENKIKILRYILKWNPNVNTICNENRNILTSYLSYGLPKHLWQTLIQHLAKLLAIDSTIHPSILKIISENIEYKTYFEKCNQELQLAKSSKIYSNSWVSYFNLLMDDKINLLQYAGNLDLLEDFSENNLIEKFPTYAVSIYKRFSKAVDKRIIWFQAATKVSSFFPVAVDPEHLVIKKIINFLNFEDLKNLCY